MKPLTDRDPLERRATRSLVEDLHRQGLLSDLAREEALARLAASRDWWRPLSALLASLGTALLLAGIVFFFASNWDALSRFEKLGLALVPLLASLAVALLRDLDSLAGRLALTAATVSVGVVLAVFGQVYQTGADAWQLFATWALLTLGWAALSLFTGHLVTWMVVAQVAVATAWEQVLHPGVSELPAGLFLVLAALSLSLLGLLILLERRGERWADRPWARRLLLAAGLGQLVLPAFAVIADRGDVTEAGPFAALIAVAAIGASWWLHRRPRPDLPSLVVTAGAALVLVLTLIGRPLFEISDDWPALFLFGLIVSGAVAGAVVLLRREQRLMKEAA